MVIKQHPEFRKWMSGLKDASVRAIIARRVERLAGGLAGDARSVGGGVSELRIHVGAGWRVYFTRRGAEVIVLLIGGHKGTQDADIRRAQTLAAELE